MTVGTCWRAAGANLPRLQALVDGQQAHDFHNTRCLLVGSKRSPCTTPGVLVGGQQALVFHDSTGTPPMVAGTHLPGQQALVGGQRVCEVHGAACQAGHCDLQVRLQPHARGIAHESGMGK